MLSKDDICCLGGDGEFDHKLKAIVQNLQKGDRFAFIRDAEMQHPSEHLKKFRKSIETWKKEKERTVLDLLVPTKLGFFEECQTQVGIFVMPSDNSAGCIEDLCIKMIGEQPLSDCVERFFTCI